MKNSNYLSVIALANLLLASVTISIVAAGEEKGSYKQRADVSRRGGTKGSTNQNAQWSADPHRGWVRSDETPGRDERQNSSNTAKQTDGKNTLNAKGRKRF